MLKDFGSVLAMHRDSRNSLLAALREVYDGDWTRHVGTDGGRTLDWSGKVGLIAGCTGSIDSHHSVMGMMGERFVLYRLPPVDGAEQVHRALARGNHETAMRTELAAAVKSVLDNVDLTSAGDLDPGDVERLTDLAELAVRCRSAVERDGYSREVELIPEPEAPARIALVLRRLLDGLAAIGVSRPDAWRLAAKIALDSMPAVRRVVLQSLMDAPSAVATKDMAERLGYPTTTTRRALEDLAAHGIAYRDGARGIDLWRPTKWCRERWLAAVSETSEGA